MGENSFNIFDFDPKWGGVFFIEIPIKDLPSKLKFFQHYEWLKAELPKITSSGKYFLLYLEILPQYMLGDFSIAEILVESKKTFIFKIEVHVRKNNNQSATFTNYPYIQFKDHKIFFSWGIVLGEDTLSHVAPSGLLPKEFIFTRTNSVVYMMRTREAQKTAKLENRIVQNACSFPILPRQKLHVEKDVFEINNSATAPNILITPPLIEINNADKDTINLEVYVKHINSKEQISIVHKAEWLEVKNVNKIDENRFEYVILLNDRLEVHESNRMVHSAIVFSTGRESVSVSALIRAGTAFDLAHNELNEESIGTTNPIEINYVIEDGALNAEKQNMISPGPVLNDVVGAIKEETYEPISVLDDNIIKEDDSYSSSPYSKAGVEFIWIKEGVFQFGPNDTPKNLEGFFISKYPITNEQYYTYCKTLGISVRPSHWKTDDNAGGKTYSPDKADHPVVNVSYSDAVRFCRWLGGRLPSEEEWERVARFTDGRDFPWGYTPSYWEEIMQQKYCNIKSGKTTSVNEFPLGKSMEGVEDLIGNVWEWTSSQKELKGKKEMILKGSCFRPGHNNNFKATHYIEQEESTKKPEVGFRCVIDHL